MAVVHLDINGRSYPIACNPGEEDRIRQIGIAIDQRVRQLAQQIDDPSVTDAHIMVLFSLMLTDEVWRLRQALQHYQEQEQKLTDEVDDLRLDIAAIADSLK